VTWRLARLDSGDAPALPWGDSIRGRMLLLPWAAKTRMKGQRPTTRSSSLSLRSCFAGSWSALTTQAARLALARCVEAGGAEPDEWLSFVDEVIASLARWEQADKIMRGHEGPLMDRSSVESIFTTVLRELHNQRWIWPTDSAAVARLEEATSFNHTWPVGWP